MIVQGDITTVAKERGQPTCLFVTRSMLDLLRGAAVLFCSSFVS